jgi:hypothetical protein
MITNDIISLVINGKSIYLYNCLYMFRSGMVIKSQSREYFRLSRRVYDKTDQIIKTKQISLCSLKYALCYVYSVTRFNNHTFFSKTTREMTYFVIIKKFQNDIVQT